MNKKRIKKKKKEVDDKKNIKTSQKKNQQWNKYQQNYSPQAFDNNKDIQNAVCNDG